MGRAAHLWAPVLGHFKGVFEAFLKGLPCPAESWGAIGAGTQVQPLPCTANEGLPGSSGNTNNRQAAMAQPWLCSSGRNSSGGTGLLWERREQTETPASRAWDVLLQALLPAIPPPAPLPAWRRGGRVRGDPPNRGRAGAATVPG